MDMRLFWVLMVSMGLALGFLKLFSGATQEWVSFTSEIAQIGSVLRIILCLSHL
jgi:hypothetical protein